MEPHPSDLWRDDFDADELARWMRDVLEPFDRSARERGDRATWSSIYGDDLVVSSQRQLGSPELSGHAALDLLWDVVNLFPAEEIDVVRVEPPGSVLLRIISRDDSGNELGFLIVTQVHGGVQHHISTFDDTDEVSAIAEFERRASQY